MSGAGPSSAWMLAALFRDEWPEAWNPYALNAALGLPPWLPALPTVWLAGDEVPEWEQGDRAVYWREAKALLEDLYSDFKAHRA